MTMKLFRVLSFILCMASAVSCSTQEPSSAAPESDKIDVLLGQPLAIKTRTSIAGDGMSATWKGGDKLSVWAENAEGSFALNGDVFTMWHYDDVLSSAIFSATITPMAEGSYTYYATYPVPASVSGTTATYSLPSTQKSGEFNGDYDIMVAAPAHGEALSEDAVNEIDLRFSHKMHALKVTIPEGRNLLGMPVTRIEFTFPTAITGDVEVDITDPDAPAVLKNGSNKLVLDIPEGIDEGDTAWGMIFPTDISGEMTYTAFAGEYRAMPVTVNLSKVAQESHITPLSILVPELYRITYVSFSIGENLLGEQVKNISIRNESGGTLKDFTYNADNRYSIAYEGTFDGSQLSGKTFTAVFESEHAIVSQTFTMPELTPYIDNVVDPLTVPYLLFEDFSGLQSDFAYNDSYSAGTSSDTSTSGYLLDGNMPTAGWNVSRAGGRAGKCVRINVRYQSGAWVVERYSGRLDTPALSALKEGASVNLKVEFDAGCYVPAGYNTDDVSGKVTYCVAGTHTSDQGSAISGTTQGNISGQCTTMFTSDYFANAYGNDSYDATFPTYSFTATGCGPSSRIAWFPATTRDTKHIAANCCYFIYIDNIRISIASN